MKKITVGNFSTSLDDYVVSRSAVLGITRSGKSYLAKGIAEQLLEHSIPIVVFDAIGVWRHLKVPGDVPNGKGYKVVVAGGEKPDLPLTPESAPQIVRAAIRENIPLVIDLYDRNLSKSDWRQIVQESFRILLYENKGPRHIFLEESAEFIPQRIIDGQTYAEVEKLARMGGNVGLGITMINQRAQELNKAVLELCDYLFLLRQRGAHAIDNLEKWLNRLDSETSAKVAKSMPSMTQGDCWIFGEHSDVVARTRSNLIRSYHPDRTKIGQHAPPAAAVNTAEFVQKMSDDLEALIAEQKDNDPDLLRQKLAEAEEKLRDMPAPAPERIEVKTVSDQQIHEFREITNNALAVAAIFREKAEAIEIALNSVGGCASLAPEESVVDEEREDEPDNVHMRQFRSDRMVKPRESSDSADPGKGGRKILIACAQYNGGLLREEITVLTAYNRSSRDTYIQRLRAKGYADENGDKVIVTKKGLAWLGNFERLPTGDALRRWWLEKLTGGEQAILKQLIPHWPRAIQRDRITGYKRSSRDTYLQRMQAKRIITCVGRGEVKVSDLLFSQRRAAA